jgi:predicted acylesterase/phospholipase RssA
MRYLPSGLFDNSRIEGFIRRNLESNGVPNNFRLLHLERGNHLYIGATNLNTARGVIFGHDENNSVSISEAVQASTAIPGFFRPAHVGGEDYIDAAVRKTANISTAIRKGADLVIAYNPFRPYDNEFANTMAESFSSIADRGMAAVLNQTFRTMLHTRLHLGIEKLRLDTTFKGDVVLIEPSETDFEFFDMSPLAFWSRHKAARQGFSSTKENLERNYPRLQPLLRRHGLECSLDGLRRGAEELGLIAADPEAVPEVQFAAAAPDPPLLSSAPASPKRRPRLRLV